jgi:hypothetical protein
MPEHYVEITLPSKPLVNVDATIAVWSGNTKLGEILISKGSFDWKAAGKQFAVQIEWEDLAKLLNKQYQ